MDGARKETGSSIGREIQPLSLFTTLTSWPSNLRSLKFDMLRLELYIKSSLDSIFDVSLQTFQLRLQLHLRAARIPQVFQSIREFPLRVLMEDRHLLLQVNSVATQVFKDSRVSETCLVDRIRLLVIHLDLQSVMVLKVKSYTPLKEFLTLSLKLKLQDPLSLRGIQFGSQWLQVGIKSSL